ncbi:MAG: hypothetical protein CM1200mP30_27740 [Pseudomonadota bacterium]|nr:MAG: hypothetical protein CM1200mP30_27740 [Pseudomonadota bacterium]
MLTVRLRFVVLHGLVFYSGRYLASHGALANADPLKLGELSLGDYLRELKYRTVLVGKSEVRINP